MDRKELCRLLRDSAYTCLSQELEELIRTHGHDDDAFDAIATGVRDRLRREDSGSYCEPATPGWFTAKAKKDVLDRHILARHARQQAAPASGVTPAFSTAAQAPRTTDDKDDTIRQLEKRIAQLERRVRQLEQAAQGNKFKI